VEDSLLLSRFSLTKYARRPEIVLFINGLRLVLMELKKIADI
jgi:type I site-specific restriction-modification system R (restriction) subunit